MPVFINYKNEKNHAYRTKITIGIKIIDDFFIFIFLILYADRHSVCTDISDTTV